MSNSAGKALAIPQVSRGVATGDLFHDGKVDLVVENLQGGPMILRPEGGPSYHWISFEFAGTKSNRLALNARVRVTSGDFVQIDEVRSGGSYMSQNDLRLISVSRGEHRRSRQCGNSLAFRSTRGADQSCSGSLLLHRRRCGHRSVREDPTVNFGYCRKMNLSR